MAQAEAEAAAAAGEAEANLSEGEATLKLAAAAGRWLARFKTLSLTDNPSGGAPSEAEQVKPCLYLVYICV